MILWSILFQFKEEHNCSNISPTTLNESFITINLKYEVKNSRFKTYTKSENV